MAGLCEGGNEPPGSLKASKYIVKAGRNILAVSGMAREKEVRGNTNPLTLVQYEARGRETTRRRGVERRE
ncbi:hypothetical protein ANN_01324 [Periplaneta americana]|uniref:Uncharacterized protein n=1 Tax=Periplaneta americana TaxID=6978 RepID=A0ABQ8TV21_PERAM|nr:hypothetical protein ANN_01324 [Periplaneta americana]